VLVSDFNESKVVYLIDDYSEKCGRKACHNISLVSEAKNRKVSSLTCEGG
jgi:hypothetical protein